MYGHIYQMAEAVAKRTRGVSGVEVSLFQVLELMSEEALRKSGAKSPREFCQDSHRDTESAR
jgi:multimeric flavodoxin WrbA